YLGDQDWSPDLDMRALLKPAHVKARREAARDLRPGEKAAPGGKPARSGDGRREGEHTTHFSIIDADRNVVACTTTIEHGMGSAAGRCRSRRSGTRRGAGRRASGCGPTAPWRAAPTRAAKGQRGGIDRRRSTPVSSGERPDQRRDDAMPLIRFETKKDEGAYL